MGKVFVVVIAVQNLCLRNKAISWQSGSKLISVSLISIFNRPYSLPCPKPGLKLGYSHLWEMQEGLFTELKMFLYLIKK